MNASYRIRGIGCIAPGITSLEELRKAAFSRAPGTAPKKVGSIPPPAGMTAREQRRMADLTKLALFAADRCAAGAPFSSEQTGLYVGLTHGATGFLKEFHEYLFDYGPEMSSPNAFSNGVSNAPMSTISKVLTIRGGGFTLVDFENCGLHTCATAATDLALGTYESCCIGSAEEYSELVEAVYQAKGLYRGAADIPYLPFSGGSGFGVSEGSVFIALHRADGTREGCGFQPIESIDGIPCTADVIISAACALPSDTVELEHLKRLRENGHGSRGILFPKAFLGETFGASTLFGIAAGFDMIVNNVDYPQMPLHPALGTAPEKISGVESVLISGCDRTGESLTALLRQ